MVQGCLTLSLSSAGAFPGYAAFVCDFFRGKAQVGERLEKGEKERMATLGEAEK